MIEYILKRNDINGEFSYSWGSKEKQFDGDLITWNNKWLRREAFKLKDGESKVYLYDPCSHRIVNEKEEKVKDFLIDTYFWLKEDWKYTLESLKRYIKDTWHFYFHLSKKERYELKHMWDGIQIVPMHMKTIDSNLVSEQPLPTENIISGKLFYIDLITNDNNNK